MERSQVQTILIGTPPTHEDLTAAVLALDGIHSGSRQRIDRLEARLEAAERQLAATQAQFIEMENRIIGALQASLKPEVNSPEVKKQ